MDANQARETRAALDVNSRGPGVIAAAERDRQLLAKQNELSSEAQMRMLNMLIDFEPCATMRVGDIRTIAFMAKTLVHDAVAKVAPR